MTYRELIAKISDDCMVRSEDVAMLLRCMTENITQALERHEPVQIRHLGTFAVRECAAHRGIDPRTKEHIFIGKRETPGFRAGPTLKKRIQNVEENEGKA
ncbi:HU family DNA-binding protein [Christensenella intestinihominis]|uniref:HU family DNA-binding protein n=1 Tax=Christensenella intestinihominis TaxID=1851429 RepID=UPI00082AB713|nr:HU family DNA-binding protein [Christensenella intestinihominis]